MTPYFLKTPIIEFPIHDIFAVTNAEKKSKMYSKDTPKKSDVTHCLYQTRLYQGPKAAR
jgi:hypothetical protein